MRFTPQKVEAQLTNSSRSIFASDQSRDVIVFFQIGDMFSPHSTYLAGVSERAPADTFGVSRRGPWFSRGLSRAGAADSC
jgi:hypothetical protein